MAGSIRQSVDVLRRPVEIGTVQDTTDGMLVTVATSDADEGEIEIPHLQQYGFASRPNGPDADGEATGVIEYRGGRSSGAVLICADDGRYRVQLNESEVAVYHSSGAQIRLDAAGDIIITPATGRGIELAGAARQVARDTDPVGLQFDALLNNPLWDAYFSGMAAALDGLLGGGNAMQLLYNAAKAAGMEGEITSGSADVRTA